MRLITFKMIRNLIDPTTSSLVVANDFGCGKFAQQVCLENLIRITKPDSANTFVGSGYKQPAKRTIDDCISDFHFFAASAIISRRHSEFSLGAFVQSAAGPIARIVHCTGYRRPTLHSSLKLLETHRLGVLTRANPHNSLKDTLQMIGANAGMSTEIFKSGMVIGVILDILTSSSDHLNLRICGYGAARLAALAGSKAGAFGRFR